MVWLFYFGVGMLVLLLSTHALVKAAEYISRAAKISPLVIGATLVALGTSLPELTVSVVALIEKDAGLALGNIIGSNVINILMVLPLGVLIGKIRIGTTKTQRNGILLLGGTLLFMLLMVLSIPKPAAGGILIFLAFIFTVMEYVFGIEGRSKEDAKSFTRKKRERFGPMRLIMVILSVIGIIFGGITVVDSIERISVITGLSTTILGLSMTAIATSLPELITTVFAQEEHQEKLTIGNVIGSNIYNLLFVGGIAILFSGGGIVTVSEWTWLILMTVIFVWIIRHFKGRVIPKRIGLGLFILLILYLISLVYLPG